MLKNLFVDSISIKIVTKIWIYHFVKIITYYKYWMCMCVLNLFKLNIELQFEKKKQQDKNNDTDFHTGGHYMS